MVVIQLFMLCARVCGIYTGVQVHACSILSDFAGILVFHLSIYDINIYALQICM